VIVVPIRLHESAFLWLSIHLEQLLWILDPYKQQLLLKSGVIVWHWQDTASGNIVEPSRISSAFSRLLGFGGRLVCSLWLHGTSHLFEIARERRESPSISTDQRPNIDSVNIWNCDGQTDFCSWQSSIDWTVLLDSEKIRDWSEILHSLFSQHSLSGRSQQLIILSCYTGISRGALSLFSDLL
jgi:hypothetical protein